MFLRWCAKIWVTHPFACELETRAKYPGKRYFSIWQTTDPWGRIWEMTRDSRELRKTPLNEDLPAHVCAGKTERWCIVPAQSPSDRETLTLYEALSRAGGNEGRQKVRQDPMANQE